MSHLLSMAQSVPGFCRQRHNQRAFWTLSYAIRMKMVVGGVSDADRIVPSLAMT
ncbi:hypothetical protein [Scytonema sp. HK-05]|uniref:hypothetical protein n=1 Tax=Scytonema sp. HK-05 TaxID=1137095 RepID=UPI001300D712|nr:hypothetical protein [Scytonema sp. HK-05]